MVKKRFGGTQVRRREETIRLLTMIGEDVYNMLYNGEFPYIKLPSRSVSNIVYSEEEKGYVLGSKTKLRTAANFLHIKKFAQFIWVTYFAKELVRSRKTSTLRDVYYSSQAYGVDFDEQSESDELIMDLESVVGRPREDFNIFPAERAAIFGDLTIEYTVPGYEGKRINLTSHPDGLMIGHSLRTSEFVETSAERVFVIEKDAIFNRFIEEGIYRRYKAILISTSGQAPRAARYLIRRLNQELGLPVYIFTDGDVWGLHIAGVIIYGSANSAHVRELHTPDAKWIGVWASDIERYNLPTDPFTEIDMKRLQELMRDPRYKGEIWQRELEKFRKLKRKSELEAFSRYGLTYIVDTYLKNKMEEINSL
jgi:DNA topoisomerase-6 subunit A